jgi:hypothetical protein
MTFMGNLGELSPYEARDAAGFIESMQQLKERSGLTYRELEEQAARNGDVLARSTLADILRRTSLPRPDLLAAFVRACGDGERVNAWLDARDRLATTHTTAAPVPAPDFETDAQPQAEAAAIRRPRWTRTRTAAAVTALTLPLLALAAWGLLPGDSDEPKTPASPADGWVTIHPVRTPDLCLTDGRDRDGAYDSAVASNSPVPRPPCRAPSSNRQVRGSTASSGTIPSWERDA